jgi:DNA repair protein RecO (recombination protein O)
VVLRQTPLGEADRILTLYAPDLGKIRAVAKGVRRTKSKLAGNLELLNQVSVSLSEGRNLDIVNESEVIQSFRSFKEDLERVSKAIYVAELVDGFSIEQSGNFPLYQLLIHTLEWMSRAQNAELLLRYFESRLLDYTGYKPEIKVCVECQETLEPGGHFFVAAQGGVLCPNCRMDSGDTMVPISLNAMKVLRFLMREKRYDKVDELTVPPGLVAELERLLCNYIQSIVEKDFKSAEFMHLVSFN